MAGPRVRRDAIQFEFVPVGSRRQPPLGRSDRLWLDVGNELSIGCVDQHHLAAYAGSTASLTLQHPELIWGAVRSRRRRDEPFTLVLHRDPDLDAAIAAHVAISFLTTGEPPRAAETLARYADQIDQGCLGLTPESPYSLYAAHAVLGHRLALRNWTSEEEMWNCWIASSLRVIEFVGEMAAAGAAVPAVDAFACPGELGIAERREIDADLERYRRKLAAPATRARRLRLHLPGQLGGSVAAQTLCVRDVQSRDDPERCVFFKDWARAEFVALSVYQPATARRPARAILSVRPDSGASLRGLGSRLEEAETNERRRRFGADDRDTDPGTGAPLPARPGYASADPWYDGRSHGYTIVDSPRRGTVLDPDAVENVFTTWAGDEPPAPAPVVDPATTPLVELSRLAQTFVPSQGSVAATPAEIFLSYPHARQRWVLEQLYPRLCALRGASAVFFDVDHLHAGVGWLARLAGAISQCRVFVPVYCREYFASEFCQWELQLAIVRDPLGAKGILRPLLLEPVELPDYCRLIQAHTLADSSLERFLTRLAF